LVENGIRRSEEMEIFDAGLSKKGKFAHLTRTSRGGEAQPPTGAGQMRIILSF
jgi:hypothetical protein